MERHGTGAPLAADSIVNEQVEPERGIRVLLVEDDPGDARLVGTLLRIAFPLPDAVVSPQPYTVTHVVRLQEAVALLGTRPIDVILLDLSLPDAEGLQALTRLYAHVPWMPIVVMSANRDEALALTGVRSGAQDFLVKGRIDSEVLVRSLRYAIARKHDEQERDRQATAIRASEQRLAGILSNAPLILFTLDHQGRCTQAAGKGLEALGQHHGLVPGCSLLDDLTVLPGLHHLVRLALSGEPSLGTSEGVGNHFDVWCVPEYDEHGTLIGAIGVALDVTVRTQALRAAEQGRLAAEELAQLRSDFVGSVSHELRTPLTAIIGFAELMQFQWPTMSDAQRAAYLGKVVRSADRLRRLVDDLLLLSRLNAYRVEVRPEPIMPADLARHAAEEVQATYPGQRIDLAGPDGTPVLADPDRALQVLVILLDNAAKYSDDGSPIALSWAVERRMLRIMVRDFGPGVSSHGRELLFTRFGRLPDSRLRAGRVGTGLGLYLGRQLAQAMNGRLDLEETGPGGSIFCLRLPLLQPALDTLS